MKVPATKAQSLLLAIAISANVLAPVFGAESTASNDRLRVYKESLASDLSETFRQKHGENAKTLTADHISDAAVMNHMQKANALNRLENEIKTRFADRFASSYVEERDVGDLVLHISIKNLQDEEKKRLSNNYESVIFHASPYSRPEIRHLVSRILNKIRDAGAPGLLGGGYADQSGHFIVSVLDGWETFVRHVIQGDSELSELPIKIEISRPLVANASPNLWAGMPINNFTQHGGSFWAINCTAGFNVVGGIYPFTITAGHCGNTGDKIYTVKHPNTAGEFYGTITESVFRSGDRSDYAIIGNDNFKHSTPGKYIYMRLHNSEWKARNIFRQNDR